MTCLIPQGLAVVGAVSSQGLDAAAALLQTAWTDEDKASASIDAGLVGDGAGAWATLARAEPNNLVPLSEGTTGTLSSD